MTTEHANVIIYLMIFLCVLNIAVLFRVTQVMWYVSSFLKPHTAAHVEEKAQPEDKQ
jgi:hypothetical protein